MSARVHSLFLILLLSGAAVNLAAGVPRPLKERAILSTDHYPAADLAAAAVRLHVPAAAPLRVVVYDGDMLGELDCAIWADYRLKWLLYPRRFRLARFVRDGAFRPDERYPPPPVPQRAGSGGEYLLFFRVTLPPELPMRALEVLAQERMFVLVRVPHR